MQLSWWVLTAISTELSMKPVRALAVQIEGPVQAVHATGASVLARIKGTGSRCEK